MAKSLVGLLERNSSMFSKSPTRDFAIMKNHLWLTPSSGAEIPNFGVVADGLILDAVKLDIENFLVELDDIRRSEAELD